MVALRSTLRATCAFLLSSLAVAAPSAAWANMAAIQRAPAVVDGMRPLGKTNLRVDHERLSLSCAAELGRPVCAFEARYEVKNPGREREEVAVAFYGMNAREVRVTVDGAPATGAPSEAEMKALDEAVQKDAAPVRDPGQRPDAKITRSGFRLAADAGSTHAVVVTGKVDGGGPEWIPEGYGMPAVNARHLIASSHPRRRVYDVAYLLSPIRTWKGDATIDVQVSYTEGLQVSIAGEGSRAWARRRVGDRTVATRSIKASQEAAIELRIELPVTPFRNGGPFVAIGGTVGSFKGVRGRVGYEVAAPDWLMYSLSADTDFRRRFIVTPLVEAASPGILILPSFGLGAGLPVQIAPATRAGARIQADLHWYPVGFVTSVDIYPNAGAGNPGFVEASFLAQLAM